MFQFKKFIQLLSEHLIASFFVIILSSTISIAAENFVVNQVRVEGLQRISFGTVANYLPIKKGDLLTSAKTAEVIRTLYKTGFFSDVALDRRGNTLIIKVVERPTIGSISISGNKKITSKQLSEALKGAELIEGRVFNDATLTALKQALIQQYSNLGYQDVSVDAKVTKMERNRVALDIKVNEGIVTKIRSIKITGNKAFSRRQILRGFALTTARPWSFMTGSNQFAKEKLDADLENLHFFYLDHGYLQFKVNSLKTEVSSDKKHVDIIIDISEGPIYRISGWEIKGGFIGKKKEIDKLVTFKKQEIFSRKKTLEVTNNIGKLFGDAGYGNPEIKIEPSIDPNKREVFITVRISPGKRVYVRHIDFSGNNKTKEYVLRREMRQQEGGVFSLAKINESKRRLNNLGYLQDVDIKVEPVTHHSDQVDLIYNVKEVSSAGASVQFGYSDTDRFIFGANIHEQNFLGTGKAVSLQFNRSSFSNVYSFRYFNPYYTANNISFDFQIYDQTVKPESIHLSSYTTNSYGASAIYGVPLSDYNRIDFGYGFEHTEISLNSDSSMELRNFIKKYGSDFNNVRLITGWNYSKLDRAIFPTMGFATSLNLEAGIPTGIDGNLEYYKALYKAVYYHPMTKFFVLRLNADLGYGDRYGGIKDFPIFKNFYCGGIGSVRGYEGNSLGPRDSRGNPLGGNVLTEASLGIVFPNPLGENVRTLAFVDVGNVFKDQFSFSGLRSSAGIQAEWRAPIGAVFTFSLATPISQKDIDRKDLFQFNIGASV